MPTLGESPDAKAVLRDIKPTEVSAVDVPAIGEPHMVVKGMSNRLDVAKANEPSDSMSREELVAAREARSKAYGIEVLESGSHLTYPSSFPTKLDEYGDPVNLKYPTDTKERAANARVRFKQNADAYKQDSSKKVVHERIVRAELQHGIEPGYDAEDPLDQMLPSDLKDELTKSETTEKQGGPMSDKKLDENDVSRPVMKVVHKRLTSVMDSINGLSDVVKNLEVTDEGADKPPQALVDMTKSLAAEIRSFLPSNEVPVEKRGISESVLSLADITKRQDDIEKAGAVSYLVRDRYVDIVQSVSEYMTTYVDGIEHDDAGPMLIPVGLDSTVDKAASELESLVEEYDTEEPSSQEEPDSGEEGVAKAADMTVREAFDRIMKAFDASQEMIKSAATTIVGEPQESASMNEETTEQNETATDEMAADASETESTESSEPAAEETAETEPAEEPVAKSDNLVLKAIEALEKKLDEKFEKKFDAVEKSLDDIRSMAKASEEKVDKALRKRADSRGGAPDRTTKVTEKSNTKDEGSFTGVLGLRSAE